MTTRRSRRGQQDEEVHDDLDAEVHEETEADEVQDEKEATEEADEEDTGVKEPEVYVEDEVKEEAEDVEQGKDGNADDEEKEEAGEAEQESDEDADKEDGDVKIEGELDADKENDMGLTSTPGPGKRREEDEIPDDADELLREVHETPMDPEIIKQQEIIDRTPRTTELEHALYECLMRKESQVERLSGEVTKLKAFISKRKQTYKRKRKDEGAPTRALSAYNIFVQDRFSKLAKENEQALKSSDSDAQLKRVPPASLVASTGNQWKELSAEETTAYEDR